VLANLGQTVTTAPSGSDAVALFRAGERYDLVLCDLGMPRMNGWQTAREIRAVAPETRIHMLTGWAQEIAPDDPLRALVDGVQGKPLPLEELERLLSAPA
jgi:CheY-like chemotaxis protein